MNIYDKMICYGLYKQEPSLSTIDQTTERICLQSCKRGVY